MKSKILAVLSASMLCLTAFPLGSFAEEEAADSLPDWIPQSFTEAFTFDAEHGRTFIADGYLCCVRNTSANWSSVTYLTETTLPEPVFQQTYTFTTPQKPDKSDTEAYAAYQAELDALGVSSYEAEKGFLSDGMSYEVTVWHPEEAGDFFLHWSWLEDGLQVPRELGNFTFTRTEDGELTETDMYSWLPDSIGEFYSFIEENGNLCTKNGYIIFCDNVAMDGGYDIFPAQEGTAEMRQVLEDYISKPSVMPAEPGNNSHVVMVYEPVTSGTVRMSFKQARYWQPDGEDAVNTEQCYAVGEDLSIREISEAELTLPVLGDVNADGELNVPDIIMLQKYLLGIGTLTNGSNGDCNGDGVLDAFDLCMMKRTLTKNSSI